MECDGRASAINNSTLIASARVNEADVYRLEGKNQQAEALIREALQIYKKTGSTAGQAIALLSLGNVSSNQSRPLAAISFFEQAAQGSLEAGDYLTYTTAVGNEAEAVRVAKQYSEAARLDDIALRSFREIGNREGEANTLIALANTYFGSGNMQAALNGYRSALEIANLNSDPRHVAMAHASIGNVLMKQHHLQAAEGEITEAQKQYQETNDELNRTAAGALLAEVNARLKRPCAALSLFEQSEQGAKRLNNLDLLKQIEDDKNSFKLVCVSPSSN